MDRLIKKQKFQSNQSNHRYGFDLLPREIVLDIVSRLPITSLQQLNFVCKSFYNLLHSKELVNLHFSRAIKNDPCFIFHTNYPLRNQLYFLDQFSDQVVRKINIPFANSMPEFKVVGSCHGLLCLCDTLFSNTLYVYNPFTRNYMELPKSVEFEVQKLTFGFGYHPVTKEYKVIKIINYANMYLNEPGHQHMFRVPFLGKSEVQLHSLGSKTWRSLGQVDYCFDWTTPGILLNGKIHWLTQFEECYERYGHRGSRIVSFDLADETFREVPKIDFGAKWRIVYWFHLAVLGDCLAATLALPHSEGGGQEIWVMREYNVKESWVKEYIIGDYTPKLNNFQQQLQPLMKPLCLLNNGELLLKDKVGKMVSYDPQKGVFRILKFHGMPNFFQTVVHVGCLNWIDLFQN